MHRCAPVLAGLAAVLLSAAPQVVFAQTASTIEAVQVEPVVYDRADFYEEAHDEAAIDTLALTPVYISDEMKYFTKYESNGNYDQGFSRGDGYNALGYYQFDRRYSLVSFISDVYAYNPQKYAMFAPVIARGDELSDGSISMYDDETESLTELAQLAEDAWHAAYAADPAEFSALQDAYAYNNYYAVTERWLAKSEDDGGLGISLEGRADCVKGLIWSMTNLFGSGGVRWFITEAALTNDMTDREMVNALVDALVGNIAERYPNQPQYHTGWINRYERERADCLAYIAEDEAAAGDSSNDNGNQPSEPEAPETPDEPAGESSVLQQFSDYEAGGWYALSPDDLTYAVEAQLMKGRQDGTFGFTDSITRADVAVVLHRMAGEPAASSTPFSDVDYNAYYGRAIAWCRAEGIISGYAGSNTFGPNDPVTREQLACMLNSFVRSIAPVGGAGGRVEATLMPDWSSVSSWAQEAVAWAVDADVISGSVVNGEKYLDPLGQASRCQVGVMVARLHRDILS